MEGQKYRNESGYARKPAYQICILKLFGNLVKAQGVSLALENGKIYWTDWVTDKIQLAKLGGSAIEDVIINDLDTPHEFMPISC